MDKSVIIHELSEVYANEAELNGKITISENCTITCYGLLKIGKTSLIAEVIFVVLKIQKSEGLEYPVSKLEFKLEIVLS